jgi:hypothetical protein
MFAKDLIDKYTFDFIGQDYRLPNIKRVKVSRMLNEKR